MKCFGYTKNDSENLQELGEITFQTNPETLREIAAFFVSCANNMEADLDWEHEHFCDQSSGGDTSVDVIVFKQD